MKKILAALSVIFVCSSLYSQSINLTLGTAGVFTLKDASTSYFTLSQSTGQVNILKTLRLENTTSATTGVIFKGVDRFMHNYGTANTFMGINAGNFTLIAANNNTGIGYNSLYNLSNGDENTAMGYRALYFNSTGSYNTAVGFQSLYNNSTGTSNTAFGLSTLFSNTTGHNNTAVGYQSLVYNTTGFSNTALGQSSLYYNTTGYWNTAVGDSSLFSNTTGYWNTAVGNQSLNDNTIGQNNTAVGYQSLHDNTTGSSNIALGNYSLYYNTTGYWNTAVGVRSLQYNTTGINNTAVGYTSLQYNTTGLYNTALGWSSLGNNATGDSNTALGFGTGSNITTGNNLTCIGFGAQPTSGTANNQITLGNSSVTSLRCAVTTITALSDARDKKNIADLSLGIDFLMKLKPRTYNWDKREWYDNNVSDGCKMNESPTAGFIAQELDEAQTTAGVEWLNLVLKDNPEKWEATPGNLLPIVVKAIQDLKAENDELSKGLLAEKNKNEKLSAEVESLKDMKVKLAELEQAQMELIKMVKSNNSKETQSIKTTDNK